MLCSVKGCETTGIYFTPDDTSMFVSIQHPGEGGSIAAPTSDWPNRLVDGVARLSVLALWRTNGTAVGYGTIDPARHAREFPIAGLAIVTAAGVMAGVVALRSRGARQPDATRDRPSR